MQAYRKNIVVLLITGLGVLGLMNVSVQLGRIVDFFPKVNISLLLAEELTETEGSEKGTESFSQPELILSKAGYIIHTRAVNEAVEVYLHNADMPVHPAFEKATPPPKA